MTRAILALAIVLGAAACGAGGDDALATGETTQALSDVVANGSFETGDYTGWTLQETPAGNPTFGTWGIAQDGQTLPVNASVFDFADGITVGESSPGLPITYHATDGKFVALQLQNGPQDHRMFQTVALPSCPQLLLWDMDYNSHVPLAANQSIAVNIRNASTDAILATPFKLTSGAPVVSTMTPQQIDLSSFAGQTVRLDYELNVQVNPLDAAFDHIRIICKGLAASPSALDFGTVPSGQTSGPKTTTITNFGTTNLTIQTKAASSPFSITAGPALPVTLAPGGSATFTLVYAPSAAGAQTGTFTLTSTDPNGPTIVALTGIGGGSPQLTASPTEVDFGPVQIGDTLTKSIDLKNSGAASLTISSASVGAPFAIVSGTLPVTLAPGQSTPLGVTFTAASEGLVKTVVQIASNDPASPTGVEVTGVGVDPTLALSTDELAFGGQRVGTTSAAQTVRATNTGVGAVTISAASTSGVFAEQDAGLPVTLAPGDFYDFAVTFTPGVEGPATGQLALTTTADGSPLTVDLDGTGIAPHIAVSPSPVDFGNQRVGTTGHQAVVVTNTGTDTLTISAISTTGPYADADAVPTQIAPNGSQTLTVAFTPTAEGSAPGTLTLASDDAASPALAVGLSGTGVIGKVSIDPGAVHFANQRIGTTSGPALVTVTNAGTDTLTIASAALGGGPFALTALGGTVLAPGDSTQFAVTFSPTAVGDASTVLAITSDAPSSPDGVPITGTGVEPLASASPTSLAFGNQRTGTTSATRSFTLSNPGSSTLTVSALSASAGFTATGPALPFTVAPGGSQAIAVAFAPTTPGAATGSVTIATDATASPTVTLTGTGIEPSVSASTTLLAFGKVRLGAASAPQLATLTNTGTAPLVISGLTAPAGFAVTPTSFPITVLPGGHATFSVTFAPTTAGVADGALVIASDAPTSPTQIALTATGVQAIVSIDPPRGDFGDVRVGQASAPITFTLANPGSDTYTVTSVKLAAPFAITTALTLPAAIAPGATLTFDVVFSPTVRASAATAVSIATDAGFASIPLTGRGVASLISASATALPFGPVAIGASSTLPLTVTNTGDASLTISGLAVTGADAADFTLPGLAALPITIAPGDALALSVLFTPADHGTRVGQLTVTSDALAKPTLVVALTGSGTGPRVGVAPIAIDFGATNVGVAAPAKSVTVTNTGETDLIVSAIVLAGANPADFAVTTALPLTVHAGASTSVGLTFTPSAVGKRGATATVQTDDTLTTPPTITLTGTGESPAIEVTPPSLAFGDVRIGAASTASVVVTNPGSGPLTISALELSGPDAAAITLDATPLPLVLAPGTAHVVHVTFTPVAVASASATLAILSDDPATPSVAVPITGAGVSPTVAIDPSTLDFGGQLVGHTSAARQVHVHNAGSGPLELTALEFAGAQAGAFTLVSPPALPATIAPGAELDVAIAFAPTAATAAAADLQLATDSADAPDAVVHLTGLGLGSALSVSPATLAFGTVHAGARSAPVAVTLTNLTSDPITLVDGVLAGGRPGDFTVSSIAGPLAPGASATAMVTYAPPTAAVSAATLTFGATDPAIPSAIVELSGNAVSSFISVSPMLVGFDQIEVGDHSGPKAVAITNVSSAPITVASVTSDDAEFVVDASAATTAIAPGGSASFTIAFAPTAEGSAMANVAITLVGGTAPELAVTASGDGTAKPAEGCDAGGGSGGALALIGLALITARGRARSRRT